MERFLGGSAWAVFLRLVIISIITGIALSALGYHPAELFRVIPDLLRTVYDLGLGWVQTVFQYFLLGAVIVIPVWLIIRFFKYLGGEARKDRAKQ